MRRKIIDLINKVYDSCMSCTMYKSIADKQIDGTFNISVLQIRKMYIWIHKKLGFAATFISVYVSFFG